MPKLIRRRSLEFLGFPDYCVDTGGTVWSRRLRGVDRYIGWHPLTTYPDKKGYLRVQLCCQGVRKFISVHCLVLFAFTGPRPFEKAQARHLDDDNTNNRLSNLCWGTQSENMQDLKRNGRFPSRIGERNAAAILTEDQVREIRRLYVPRHLRTATNVDRKGKRSREEYLRYSKKNLAKMFNVSVPCIDFVISGKHWGHVI